VEGISARRRGDRCGLGAVRNRLTDSDRPKALNYHVTNRGNLLRLVAEDVFESTFTDSFAEHFKLAEDATDWRGAIRSWAFAVRDSLVATGVLTNYYRISSDNLAVFETVELVLERLLEAGFDETPAGRALIFVTHFAMSVGRDQVMENRRGEHPQAAEVERLSETALGLLKNGPGQGSAFEVIVPEPLTVPDP
jgi:hypothetical protein